MKNNSKLLLIFILLITNIAIGCKEAREIQRTGNNSSSTGNSLLWKIEGNGLSSPSYLFGTIHIIPKSEFNIGPLLRNAIKGSEVMVMEVKLDAQTQMQAAMGAMFPMSSGITIEDYMTEAEFERFSRFLLDTLKVNQMEFMVYKRMKPIFVSQVLIKDVLGEDPASYELELIKIADSSNMEILGLESVSEQIGFFDSIPIEEQVKMLVDGIDNIEEDRLTYQRMVKFYKEQNLDSLYAILYEDAEFAAYTDLLIDQRNRNWIPILKKVMAAQPAFIAVGAGHLPGEEGLINLLRREGYIVTPVK